MRHLPENMEDDGAGKKKMLRYPVPREHAIILGITPEQFHVDDPRSMRLVFHEIIHAVTNGFLFDEPIQEAVAERLEVESGYPERSPLQSAQFNISDMRSDIGFQASENSRPVYGADAAYVMRVAAVDLFRKVPADGIWKMCGILADNAIKTDAIPNRKFVQEILRRECPEGAAAIAASRIFQAMEGGGYPVVLPFGKNGLFVADIDVRPNSAFGTTHITRDGRLWNGAEFVLQGVSFSMTLSQGSNASTFEVPSGQLITYENAARALGKNMNRSRPIKCDIGGMQQGILLP